MRSVDDILKAMPAKRRAEIERRILALIETEERHQRQIANGTAPVSLKKVRERKRNGV